MAAKIAGTTAVEAGTAGVAVTVSIKQRWRYIDGGGNRGRPRYLDTFFPCLCAPSIRLLADMVCGSDY